MRRSIDEMVVDHLRRSEMTREQRLQQGQQVPNPVITISRTMGSGGRIVARKLADDLGFSLWDRDIIDLMAVEAELPPQVVEAFDEKTISELELVVQALLGRHELAGFMYPKHLARAIGTIAGIGNAVILGRGANFLLSDALNIRMDASLEHRITNMLTYEDIDRQAAETKLRNSDRERERFIERVFGRDKARCAHYDLCVWMDKFTADDAAEIIKTAFQRRFKSG